MTDGEKLARLQVQLDDIVHNQTFICMQILAVWLVVLVSLILGKGGGT